MLSSVSDIARITIALTGVNGVVGATASMGLLPGDVSQSGKVTAADIAAIKAKRRQYAGGQYQLQTRS